jgi:hypothetical protein
MLAYTQKLIARRNRSFRNQRLSRGAALLASLIYGDLERHASAPEQTTRLVLEMPFSCEHSEIRLA